MKTEQRIGIIAVIFILLIATACNDTFEPAANRVPVAHGYGRISIELAGEETAPQSARTIFPFTAFDAYTYTFTKTGEANGTVKIPDSDGLFTLELGEYTVAVHAYIGAEPPYALAASGESPPFNVAGGNNAPVSVNLSAVNTAGQGEFSYTISYPAGAGAHITMQRWPTLTNVILNPVSMTQGNGVTETRKLDAGSYLFTVLVSKDSLAGGISEAVHIYPSVTTAYAKTFQDIDLIGLAPAAPSANPPGGLYASAQNVALTTATEGAAIHYTLNGAVPTSSSAQYVSPIVISQTSALRAIAVKDGIASEVFTAEYIITQASDERIRKITFTGNTATVIFNNASARDMYLVKVNTSNSEVLAANTGGVTPLPPVLPGFWGNDVFSVTEDSLPPMGRPEARELSSRPAPVPHDDPIAPERSFSSPVVGDTRMFWVETFYNSGAWEQRQATLRASGLHGNIWVMNENFTTAAQGSGNRITAAQAQTMANRFDVIYPVSTNILGYEFGGGPGGNGGRDGDPKVQILVYSIVNSTGQVMAAGYFWGKDYYTQTQMDGWGWNLKTNLAEIFYIDASQVNTVPDYIYSTLVHEFQHMVNFNMKNIRLNLGSDSWYNEMLSLMAEDVIAQHIGIGPSHSMHVIRNRMPVFLGTYAQVGMTEWVTLGNAAYAKGFAFGAYLMRNYGGAQLLREIMHNNSSNINSVSAALNTMAPGMNFNQALSRFGEAMVFNSESIPQGAVTFDYTDTRTVNGISYTAQAVDIWNVQRSGTTQRGPLIYDLTQRAMRPHSVTVHQGSGWANRTGIFSVTLQRPLENGVELYIMAR